MPRRRANSHRAVCRRRQRVHRFRSERRRRQSRSRSPQRCRREHLRRLSSSLRHFPPRGSPPHLRHWRLVRCRPPSHRHWPSRSGRRSPRPWPHWRLRSRRRLHRSPAGKLRRHTSRRCREFRPAGWAACTPPWMGRRSLRHGIRSRPRRPRSRRCNPPPGSHLRWCKRCRRHRGCRRERARFAHMSTATRRPASHATSRGRSRPKAVRGLRRRTRRFEC
jgi:hypothetical protein